MNISPSTRRRLSTNLMERLLASRATLPYSACLQARRHAAGKAVLVRPRAAEERGS